MSVFDTINELKEKLNIIENQLNESIDKLNESIDKLCKEQNLDIDKVKSYFLKQDDEIRLEPMKESTEPLLDVYKQKDKTYYYENKPHGKVFIMVDGSYEDVGSYINNKVVIRRKSKK
jgi:hypothetical protein